MRLRLGLSCVLFVLSSRRFACLRGLRLQVKKAATGGPRVKLIASFESGNPFSGGEVVAMHASEGRKALRMDKDYASLEQAQDWLGYDFLKADLFTEARKPMNLYVEIRDTATDGYWTRVNYSTVVPPGKSTLIIPVKQLYVGEKARPGRMLILNGITRLVFGIGEQPPAPLFVDNLRLERDDTPDRVSFDGLLCLRLRDRHQPGHGGIHADHAGDPIQPRPGLRAQGCTDLACLRRPAARAAVSGFHLHRGGRTGGRRAQRPVSRLRQHRQPIGFLGRVPDVPPAHDRGRRAGRSVRETMDFDAFKAKYFRFWNVEDLPTRQHVRQVSENLFPREALRRRRERRPVEPGIPGRELGLLGLGRGDLSRGEGGARGSVSQIRGSQAPILFRQLLQARSSGTERRAAPADRGRPTPGLRRLSARSDARRLVQRHAQEAGDRSTSHAARRSRASTSR